MLSKEVIKDIILDNERFILSEVKNIVPRRHIFEPESKIKKVKILYGTRRSGKTFILYDIFKRNKDKSLYIDFEDERLFGVGIEDLQRIKDAFFELKPELINKSDIIFCFDEIQNVNGWERFVRRVVERENIDVWVAGSSSKITPRYINTSLRGRGWSIPVYPFSFEEYLTATGLSLKDLLYGKGKSLLLKSLDAYLRFGGYPEVVLSANDFTRKKILDEYMRAMILRDLIENFQIKNITLFNNLQEALFTSLASKYSSSSFYKQFRGKFPFSKTLLFKYYNYFIESLLLYEVRLFTQSPYKRRRNPPKIYLVDIGLSLPRTNDKLGRALENLVYLDLRRHGYEIYYYGGEGECDFVGYDTKGKFYAIQVAWELTEKNQERELSGLIEACKRFRLKRGYIITRDQDSIHKEDGIVINIVSYIHWLQALQM